MAKLRLEIGASITALEAGLGKAKSAVKSFASSIGGLLGAASLIAFSKSAIDAADAVADGSKRIGVSAEEYQKLRYAAEQSGAGVENVEVAFKKMNGVVQDALNKDPKAIALINSLGVSMDELAGKTQYEVFELLTNSLASFSDEGKKAALATDLFGKSGMSLIPLLGNLQSLGQELQDAGAIMSNEAVKAADEFNDSMNKLGTTLKAGLVNSGLVEYLKEAAEGFNALASSSKQVKDAKGKGLYADQSQGWFDKSAEFVGNMVTFGNFTRLTEKTNKLATGSDSVFRTEGWTKKEVSDKLDAKKKAEKDKVDRQAKAKELEEKSMAEEARANLDKQKAEYAKQEREGAKKADEALADSIQKMQQKLEIQKLLNKGLDRQAAIQEAVNDAYDKAGKDIFGNQREIDPEKLQQIKDSAGQMYDLTKEHIKPLQMEAPVLTDSVRRIGGSIGGADNSIQNAQLQVQKNIEQKLNEVSNSINSQSNGGDTWA